MVITEMGDFMYEISFLGAVVLFLGLMASIGHSGLEYLYWKYFEWKKKNDS